MEIKAELLKPYTETQRANFIVEQSHKLGYEIKETETALEAWGYTEEEKQEQERERLNMLFLTGADVERGIYQAKGMDFDDIMAFVIANPPEGLDIKALKIELKANNFYRGNHYVNAVGALLGFTSEQLDKFFETKDYHYLTTCTLTVNVVPEEATVIINDVEQKQITVPYGASVDVSVECEGYVGTAYTAFLTEDKTLDIELDKEVTDENTTAE